MTVTVAEVVVVKVAVPLYRERQGERSKKKKGRRWRERRWSVSLAKHSERSWATEQPAVLGPADTMLRLNIRCLNNQARFDPVKE